MQFREYQMISEKNLLCLTTEFEQQPLIDSLRRLRDESAKRGRQQQGKAILIFPLSLKANEVTVCIPLDRSIHEPPDHFQFTARLYCDKAVRTRHEGQISKLKAVITQLIRYIEKQNLTPISDVYCKVMDGMGQEPDMENTIADVYIGVK